MNSREPGKDPLTGILPGTLEKLYSEGEVLVDDVENFEDLFSGEELYLLQVAHIKSLVLLPMYRKESICGIAGFINPWKGKAWNIDNINVLRTFRNIVLEALKRQDLEEQLQTRMFSIQSVLEGTVMAIGQIIEIRDPYTAGHQKRVARLATAIARYLHLSDFQVLGIFYASLVHDVGKINIPAEVLTKPGKLTSLEEELVKRHPYYGWEILRNIDFPWPVSNIVLQHHEHYDGTGYPEGLKGVEIMLQARIIAVADALEAMTSDRPYRPARKLEESFATIEKFSGSFYDPEVVSACREVCEKTDLLMEDNSFSNV
jgi:putative nucleotidyltransferase with HDIG domain